MKIQLLRPDLHQIDRIEADTLALTVFEEDRPPKGLAGLVDWRLCGRLSELIVRGKVTGAFRESVLLPAYERLPVERICVFGLGKRADFSPTRAREVAWFVAESLRKLKATSFVMSLPGSPKAQIAARARMDMVLEEAVRVFGDDESSGPLTLFIVEPSEYHRELTEAISVTMRKLRALWR